MGEKAGWVEPDEGRRVASTRAERDVEERLQLMLLFTRVPRNAD